MSIRFDWMRLINPLMWIQNYPTCWEWDDLLNQKLDEKEPLQIGHHTVQIGNTEVWVSNWAYAYGTPYEPVTMDVLPSVRTRRRLRKYILRDQLRRLA